MKTNEWNIKGLSAKLFLISTVQKAAERFLMIVNNS
jgi:hypothetical protein